MKSIISIPIAILLANALCAIPASARNAGKIKVKVDATLTVDLQPTPDGPAGASGAAEISVNEKKGVQSTEATLLVSGLPDGDYSIDAVLFDETTVSLGTLAYVAPAPGGSGQPVDLVIPADLDALDIAGLRIGDDLGTVLLEGAVEASYARLRYFANVPVFAPQVEVESAKPDGGGKPKKVHGHALAHTTIKDDAEIERHFLFIGFGAPADTELTVNVNGEAVGTVTSSQQGKVKFKDLEGVDFMTLDTIVLTDADDLAIMAADFSADRR